MTESGKSDKPEPVEPGAVDSDSDKPETLGPCSICGMKLPGPGEIHYCDSDRNFPDVVQPDVVDGVQELPGKIPGFWPQSRDVLPGDPNPDDPENEPTPLGKAPPDRNCPTNTWPIRDDQDPGPLSDQADCLRYATASAGDDVAAGDPRVKLCPVCGMPECPDSDPANAWPTRVEMNTIAKDAAAEAARDIVAEMRGRSKRSRARRWYDRALTTVSVTAWFVLGTVSAIAVVVVTWRIGFALANAIWPTN